MGKRLDTPPMRWRHKEPGELCQLVISYTLALRPAHITELDEFEATFEGIFEAEGETNVAVFSEWDEIGEQTTYWHAIEVTGLNDWCMVGFGFPKIWLKGSTQMRYKKPKKNRKPSVNNRIY